MPKPVSGQLGYDNLADRPTVELRVGTRKLLTEDDSGGGGAVSDVTGTGAIDVSPTTGNVVVSLDEAELENGGAQEISVSGLSGVLADPQKIEVAAAGSLIGTRDRINFIDGTGITATVADDSGNDRVNITLAATEYWNDPYFFFHRAPASAHADSDEFTSGTLNGRWTIVKHSALTSGISAAGTVTEAGTASTTQPLITPNYRGSWFAYQGQDGGIIRQFTRPATLQVRVRLACPLPLNTGGPTALLYVGGAGGGTPDLSNNIVRVGWSGTNIVAGGFANAITSIPVIRSSGGVQDGPTLTSYAGHSRNIEFIILLTGSTTARLYIRDGLAIDQIGEGSPAAALGSGANVYMYLRFNNQWSNKGTGNVNAIGLCDYIRIRTDDMLEDYA